MNTDFWAITSYYNLAGWRSRPRNYRLFRESLSLPLLTVEWHPDGVYDLGPADADWLVQVKGGDLMWQKERLLDLALDHLPSSVKYVAWLDAEVLFCDPRWQERTRDALERHVLVQPFDRAIFLDEDVTSRLGTHEICSRDVLRVTGLKSRRSLMAMVGEVGDRIADLDLECRAASFHVYEPGVNTYLDRPAYGFAWAAKVDVLRAFRIYDRCVLGGGDHLFGYGVLGLGERLLESNRSLGWDFYGNCRSYRMWMDRAADACSGRLGVCEGTLLHLFHGHLEQRQFKSRIDGLAPFGLDLDRDIVAGHGRPWSWSRRKDELNRYFLSYIRGRREDG